MGSTSRFSSRYLFGSLWGVVSVIHPDLCFLCPGAYTFSQLSALFGSMNVLRKTEHLE